MLDQRLATARATLAPSAGPVAPKQDLVHAADNVDATLTEAHAAYRAADFHRALQLCQTVRLAPHCRAWLRL